MKLMKVEINSKLFAIYIIYIIYIWFCECMDLICFILSVPQQTIISRIFCAFLLGVLLYKIKDKIQFVVNRKYRITKGIGILFILLVWLIKSLYPDVAHDMGNYHLIAQVNEFVNYFEVGFAAGTFQIWGFRLGDRLFAPFFHMLGYRWGTLLSLFVIILLYIQIADFLEELNEKVIKNKRIFSVINPAILSLMILSVHDLVMLIASYYVDLLAIPLCIEMLRKVCIESDNVEHEYFALLGGIAFSLKMTNVVFVIPLLVVYIVKYIKKIRGIDWIKCLVLGIIPFSIYAVYNLVCTGNPIFPYYNSIFKSKYFTFNNFKDNRWGPTDLKETVLWIFYHTFKPEYRQSEIPNLHTLNISIGIILLFVGILFYFVNLFRGGGKTFPIEIHLVFLISGLLWAISTGYSRYFIFGDVLLIIVLIVSILYASINCNIYFTKYFAVFLSCLIVLFCMIEIKDNIRGREWAWRTVKPEGIVNQMSFVLRDYSQVFEYDVDAFFLTQPYYNGFAYLSDREAPIFNASYLSHLEEEYKYLYEMSFDAIISEENVYDIKKANFDDWETYEKELNNYGLMILEKEIVKNGVIDLIYIKLGRCAIYTKF